MKTFFQQYSYSIVKMFVNQFAISLFGTLLAMATSSTKSDGLSLAVSIFAVLFYLFLIYTLVWEVGAKDRIAVDVGKKPYKPHTGLLMACVASVPNFLFAVFFTATKPLVATHSWVANINLIMTIILEGMYMGMNLVLPFGAETNLNSYWWTHFLIVITCLLTSWLAYFLGFKGFRLFSAMSSDHKPDQGKQK